MSPPVSPLPQGDGFVWHPCSPGQKKRHLPVSPHLAKPALRQQPLHGLPDMPLPSPAPRGGNAPGKGRRRLGGVLPLARQQQQEALVDLANSRAHVRWQGAGRHGVGHEGSAVGLMFSVLCLNAAGSPAHGLTLAPGERQQPWQVTACHPPPFARPGRETGQPVGGRRLGARLASRGGQRGIGRGAPGWGGGSHRGDAGRGAAPQRRSPGALRPGPPR